MVSFILYESDVPDPVLQVSVAAVVQRCEVVEGGRGPDRLLVEDHLVPDLVTVITIDHLLTSRLEGECFLLSECGSGEGV